MLDHYSRAAVVVVPSRYESFGLVVIEAMRAGVPVISTAVGGLAELIDDQITGLLVPVDDSVALARAITDLLNDAARRQATGAAGRRAWERRWTLKTMAQALAHEMPRWAPTPGAKAFEPPR